MSDFVYDDHTNLCTKINNVCFLWIPKNCSSSFRTLTEDGAYTRAEPSDRVVAILRDPISRYISAIPTLIERKNEVSEEVFDYRDFVGIDKDVIQDEHTTPQSKYLEKINLDNVDFFLYNKTVLEEINKKYRIWANQIPHANRTDELQTRIKTKTRLEKYLSSNVALVNKIKDTYHSDYQLLDKYLPNWRKNEHYLGITNYNTRPAYRKFQHNRHRSFRAGHGQI